MTTLAQQLAVMRPTLNIAANSHYIFKKGGKVVVRKNDICYASLRYEGDNGGHLEECRLMLVGYKQHKDLQDAYKHYYDYVMHRSIFKDVFLNTNSAAWKLYGLKINVDLPPSVMVGGMTLVRQAHEFSDSLRLWKRLVDVHKFTEDEATLLSCTFSLTKDNVVLYRNMGGHGLFDSSQMNDDVVKNFLNRNIVKKENYLASKGQVSWKVHQLFGYSHGYLHNHLAGANVKQGQGWNAYEGYDENKFATLMRSYLNKVMK